MFSDSDVKAIYSNLYIKTNYDRSVDKETQTNNDIKIKHQEVQVIDREDKLIQTNLKEIMSKENLNIDEIKLNKFLQRAFSFVNDALNSRIDENLEFLEEEDEIKESQSDLIMRLSCLQMNSTKNMKISDICWSSNGSTLGISYYFDNHIGPCSHQSTITFLKFSNFSESKTFKEKIEIETNACIKSIDSHPKVPNIFVCSSYIGEIYLINISQENDQIQYISQISSNFHKECVTVVRWINFPDGNYYILSLSEEGRLLLWNPENKLAYPTIGFALKFKIGKNTFPVNPTVLAENPHEKLNFIIGCFDGNIYKCALAYNNLDKENNDTMESINRNFQNSSGIVWRKAVRQLMCNMTDNEISETKTHMERFCKDKNIFEMNPDEFFKLKPDLNKLYKNALKSNYEKHLSLVTGLEYNIFVKNLFLTCSYDGSLRVYHQNYHGSKYILSHVLNQNYYSTAIWSPFKPSLIICGNCQGKISFLKISNKSIKQVFEIERKLENSLISYPVSKLNYNKFYKNVIAVVYEDGILDLYKISDDLCENTYDELDKLNKVIFNLLN